MGGRRALLQGGLGAHEVLVAAGWALQVQVRRHVAPLAGGVEIGWIGVLVAAERRRFGVASPQAGQAGASSNSRTTGAPFERGLDSGGGVAGWIPARTLRLGKVEHGTVDELAHALLT